MSVLPWRVAALGPFTRTSCHIAAVAVTTAAVTPPCHRTLTTHTHAMCSKKRMSKVPQQPVTSSLPPAQPVTVDLHLVQLLERLSLVDFANEEGIERLQDAISMADRLTQVDTTGVEPLVTVLENRSLPLAEDEVLWKDQKDELLSCSRKTLDDYYVVPPGNITHQEEKGYHATLRHQQEAQVEEENKEEERRVS